MPSARAKATAPPAFAMMSLMSMPPTVGDSYPWCQPMNAGYSYPRKSVDVHCAGMTNTASIGTRINALRKERKLTQAVVAEAVGLERASLSMIERGHDRPGLQTLRALADFFGVTLDYLESGTLPPRVEMPPDAAQAPDEAELLAVWRRLNEADRLAIVGLMERLTGLNGADIQRHSIPTPKPNRTP